MNSFQMGLNLGICEEKIKTKILYTYQCLGDDNNKNKKIEVKNKIVSVRSSICSNLLKTFHRLVPDSK